MSRRLALVLAAAAGLLVAWGVGRLFVTSVGSDMRVEEPAGVLLVPPPDAVVTNARDLDRAEAARALARHAAATPGAARAALVVDAAGSRVILVLDREAGTIEERRGGASGTRVGTVWKGGLEARLAAARERGTFEVPGLAPPEEKNLYH